jgi:hypothetical protein
MAMIAQVNNCLARSFKSISSNLLSLPFQLANFAGTFTTFNLLDLAVPGQQVDLVAARPGRLRLDHLDLPEKRPDFAHKSVKVVP